MESKISIIVPIYNVEQQLRRCIDSIINQTYNNIEIILVNDGSTDGSGKICDDYSKKDKRIKVIHKKNQGVSIARNSGLKIASGTYIGFVDGDDEIEIDMYELLMKNMEKYNADISHCSFYKVINNVECEGLGINKKLILDNEDGIKECLTGKNFMLSVCNKIYKKEVIKDIYFEENKYLAEDTLFNFYAFMNSRISVFDGKPKYLYTTREGSALKSEFNSKRFDIIYFTEKILNLVIIHYPQFIDIAEKRDILENILLLRGIVLSKDKNKFNEEYKKIIKKLRVSLVRCLNNREISKYMKISLVSIFIIPKLSIIFIDKIINIKYK